MFGSSEDAIIVLVVHIWQHLKTFNSSLQYYGYYYYLQSDSVANVLPALHALHVVIPRANCHVSSKKSAFVQQL